MGYDYSEKLNPKKALIWRIVHKDNIPWILKNGLYSSNSSVQASHWIPIGNADLIDKRAARSVNIDKGGTLSDYIPFYFTPFSPMLMNIQTGYGGIKKRPNEDIVILVTSLYQLQELNLPFIFTDRHAYCSLSNYYTDIADLDKINWDIIQKRNFKRDPDDLSKTEKYQAEALIYKHCPVDALEGMICYTKEIKIQLENWLQQQDKELQVYDKPEWYFS